MQKTRSGKRLMAGVGAIITWMAVLLQLYLIILNRQASVPETIVRFFSFFTILTNILVTIFFSAVLFSANQTSRFFTNPKVASAVAVYISIVGLVYNIILRFLWAPQGLQRLVDEALHSLVPVLFVLYWCLYVPKENLKWKDAFPWLLYPFIYLVFILIRGAFSSFYPYPFVDVNKLGYNPVFINCLVLFAAFLSISFLLIGISKFITRNNRRSA